MKSNSIQIPVRFQLLGQTIKVRECATLLMDENASGKSMPDKNVILLQSRSKAYDIPRAQQVHTFYHELFHTMFAVAGFGVDYADEHKVDLMAGLMLQALSTMEYKK